MTKILYGAPVKEELKQKLMARVGYLGRKPVLAIVQVGDREDSNLYIKNKIKFGEEIGVKIELKRFKDLKIGGLEDKIIEEIKNLNKDENVDGIIVQLPLPENLDTKKILESIKKEKDADGLKEIKNGGEVLVTPATARAVLAILDFYKIEIAGKKACVLGQSILAGRPISEELEKRGAEVFRCDINTKNIPEIAKGCDILVSAVGKAGLVTKDFVNKRQVVVDVGINKTAPSPALPRRGRVSENPSLSERQGSLGGEAEKSKFVGDVDFEEVEPLVSAITPVPGGIGPLTVACLFENLLDLIDKKPLF